MADQLSVVIPHYGDPQPTSDLIDILQRQEGDLDLQIIVADDCSPEPFPQRSDVDVIRREANGGFGAAVNSGASLAKHDLMLVLNSDITVEPTFITEFLTAAKPWMPAVVGTVVEEGGIIRCVGRNWPTTSSFVLETVDLFARLHGKMWFEHRIGNDVASWHSDEPQLTDWLIGVALLMPTDEFRAVGGVDERYFMNCEEIDLQRRLHEERGLPVVLLPGPKITHVGGGSSDPERRTGWLTDARFRYHEKWVGGPGLRFGLQAAAVTNLVTNSVRRAAGRDVDAVGHYRRQTRHIQHGWETRK